MAGMTCKCGEHISDNDPRVVGFLIGEEQNLASDVDLISDSRHVWECQWCGRLAIFGKRTNVAKFYSPDDGESGHLFDAHNEEVEDEG